MAAQVGRTRSALLIPGLTTKSPSNVGSYDDKDGCNGRILELSEPDNDLNDRPSLCKRKDFLEIEPEAKSHPNRTYYYRKHQDTDKTIDSCSRKLQVRKYVRYNERDMYPYLCSNKQDCIPMCNPSGGE